MKMRKIGLVILFMAFPLHLLFSQVFSNLVFYNQEGNKFYVILNGIKQNATPETNVKITDLSQPYYKAKIIFENTALGELDKTLNFNPGTETVFEIRKNTKGVYVIRWQSEVPVAQAVTPASGQAVIVYTPVAAVVPNANVNVTQTTTTTTTQTTNPNDANMNVGINVPGANINMNVNVLGDGNGTVTQTTTTTTTTNTGNYNNVTIDPNPNHTTQVQGNYIMPGYNGAIGCPWPMNDNDFAQVKQSIISKSFESSKLTIAKQVIAANCLFTKQVKEIMQLFDFEDTRLELAKYAYGYTYDIGNYYMLNDAFQFENSIEELNAFINSKR